MNGNQIRSMEALIRRLEKELAKGQDLGFKLHFASAMETAIRMGKQDVDYQKRLLAAEREV